MNLTKGIEKIGRCGFRTKDEGGFVRIKEEGEFLKMVLKLSTPFHKISYE